jgi:hypothetical protein
VLHGLVQHRPVADTKGDRRIVDGEVERQDERAPGGEHPEPPDGGLARAEVSEAFAARQHLQPVTVDGHEAGLNPRSTGLPAGRPGRQSPAGCADCMGVSPFSRSPA